MTQDEDTRRQASASVWQKLRRFFRVILSANPGPADMPVPAFGKNEWLLLPLLLASALVVRVAVAVLLPSAYHPDETFQYWEQGFRLARGYGIVPWEYRTGIRSYVMPGAIAGVIRVVTGLGGGDAAWRVIIQVLLSISSLSLVITAYFWARRVAGVSAALLAGIVTSSWFEFVYFSAKPFTEVMAAALLFPAAYLLCVHHGRRQVWPFVGGALLGAAFVMRFQLAPAVLVVALACVIVSGRRAVLPLLAAALVIVAGGMLDWVTLGSPFQSVWLNFSVNAMQDKASQFGTTPGFWFVLYYLNAWAGFVVPMGIFLVAGVKRAPLLLTVALVIVLSHSLIGHKEYRFVYPALPFLLTLASIGASRLYGLVAAAFFPQAKRHGFRLLGLLWVITSANLAAQDGFRKDFFAGSDAIAAFKLVAELPQACGLGVAGMSWVDTPGYAGLGKDLPIYPLTAQDPAQSLEPAYNIVVRRGVNWSFMDRDFKQLACFGDVCLAAREGVCTPTPAQSVNSYLVQTGQ